MNVSKQQVEAVFFAALQIKDADRRRLFLEQACAGDGELRRETEELLAKSGEADDFFEGGLKSLTLSAEEVAEVAAGGLADEEEEEEGEEIGTRIDRYKLVQKLGEGGCGTVYLAEQEIPVRRRVALKVIKLGMDTKSVIARFNAERQVLALMDSPNIARVFDAGATERGRPYFVMEWVQGAKITDFCDEHKLDTRQRLDLFIQVCAAIQHAHQKGVIHRDIKPSNILVTQQGERPVPKVIDFGIAKATEGRLADATLFTVQGQVLGTPAYMSPEQAERSGLDVDTRSDIYSLGVLLYELLTGRTPFDSAVLAQAGIEGLCRTLRETEPPRPSVMVTTVHGEELSAIARHRLTEPPQLVSQLKGDLDWIILKAMEKDRPRRYETANGLMMDVVRHLNNEPVLARPPNTFYRFQKLVRRNQVVFLAGALVVLALVTGMGTATRLYFLERTALKEQARLRQDADKAREHEARMLQQAEVRERLSLAAALLSQGKKEEANVLLAQTPFDLIEPSLDSETVLRTLGDWYAVARNWRPAVDCFRALVRINQPNSPWGMSAIMDCLSLAPALVESGDTAGYQRFRTDLLDQYGGSTVLHTIEPVTKACLLTPADPELLKRLKPFGEALEQSLARKDLRKDLRTGRDYSRDWQTLDLALLEYRREKFTNALAWAQKGLAVPAPNPPYTVMLQSLQVMSRHRLGDEARARAELAEARAAVELHFSLPPDVGNYTEGTWSGWIIARLLLSEAVELMEGNGDAKLKT